MGRKLVQADQGYQSHQLPIDLDTYRRRHWSLFKTPPPSKKTNSHHYTRLFLKKKKSWKTKQSYFFHKWKSLRNFDNLLCQKIINFVIFFALFPDWYSHKTMNNLIIRTKRIHLKAASKLRHLIETCDWYLGRNCKVKLPLFFGRELLTWKFDTSLYRKTVILRLDKFSP